MAALKLPLMHIPNTCFPLHLAVGRATILQAFVCTSDRRACDSTATWGLFTLTLREIHRKVRDVSIRLDRGDRARYPILTVVYLKYPHTWCIVSVSTHVFRLGGPTSMCSRN